jgi:hypothetical protein
VPRRPRSRPPTALFLIPILLVSLIALVLWYVSVRMSNASAIRKLEQTARQRGEPLTLAELQAKYPPIPDEENAAVALMALWEMEDPPFWKAFVNGERTLPERAAEKYDPALPYLGSEAQRFPRIGLPNSNSLAAAEAYLSAKAAHLEKVRAALRQPRCRFPIKLEDGPDALLPHLAWLKTEAQNFRIVALVAAEGGDKNAALTALKDVVRTGQILASEPPLISQLVRVACLNLALNGVEQLLSRQRLTIDELEVLRQLLEELNLPGLARSALVSERPFSLCAFDPVVLAHMSPANSSDDDPGDPGQRARNIRAGVGFMRAIGDLDADRRLILETLSEAIDLAGQETPESLRRIEALFEEVSRKARRFPPKIFSSMMLPALQKVPARFASFEARRQAALTALAVERFRLDHGGRLPETLAEIVPGYLSAIPPDPFDGKALRFRKLERGFVVYSIGSDRQDNDGQERKAGETKQTDMTVIVER